MTPETQTSADLLARSIFKRAESMGRIAAWESLLENLSRLVDNREFLSILGDENVTKDDLRDLMNGLMEKAAPKAWEKKFVDNLIDRGQLKLAPFLYQNYVDLRHEAENSFHVTIASAEKLQPFQYQNLKTFLKECFNIKTRSITATIDPKLRSGFKIRAGQKVIDQSWPRD